MQKEKIKVLVIHPNVTVKAERTRTPEEKLEEAAGLAAALDLDVVEAEIVKLKEIRPSTFLGKGKVEQFKDLIQHKEIKLVIVDSHLSPIQQRNLEKEWNAKVIDRTALILEIFGSRARTKEGKLQVELASLTYQKSRLVRTWTHLERQRGGFGFLGGPGETQIEIDRRLIGDRIVKIKKELEKVKKTRSLHRKSRESVPYPVVALVGYTNAGKSTLFNRLTGAEVVAEDMLFATLDPTMRIIKLPSRKKVILSDTVGFISDLPTELVASFRATLEEVVEADLILHVRDIASQSSEAEKKDVEEVLEKLGVEKKPVLEVLNKIDLIEGGFKEKENAIPVSALTGEGCDGLLLKIDEKLSAGKIMKISVDVKEGKIISWIYQHAERVKAENEEEKIHFEFFISDKNKGLLESLLKN